MASVIQQLQSKPFYPSRFYAQKFRSFRKITTQQSSIDVNRSWKLFHFSCSQQMQNLWDPLRNNCPKSRYHKDDTILE